MILYGFSSTEALQYHYTGKFEAPTSHWKHEDMPLAEFELFVMTEGTLYLSYDGCDFTIENGEFLLLAPSDNKDAVRRGFRPAFSSFYWLHFLSAREPVKREIDDFSLFSCVSNISPDTFCLPRQGKIPNLEKVIVLMKQLQDAVKSRYPKAALNAMSTTVVLELYSQLLLDTRSAASGKPSHKQIYHDIIDFVKLNINHNLKVADVARHFGYNEKYLSHLFASIAGIPLKQFILAHKIDAANFLLTDTNKSISQIARELGFSDSHNFARAYKKITGLSPSEYRNAFAKRMLFHK